MLRFSSLFGVACLGVCAAAAGQISSAGPARSPETPEKPVTTIKANARLVVLDVVVKDGKGRAVHGLKPSDFAVTEGNVPQTISHFEEHEALTPEQATRFPDRLKLPADVFTNYSPGPVNGAANILLIDSLNTPLRDQVYLKQQLLTYLKAVQPGTRIAIFGLNTGLVMLQGFTSDPELMKKVLLAKARGDNSPLLDDPAGGSGLQNSTADDLEDAGADATMVANARQFEAVTQSFELQLRVKYTLDAMNQLARYLSHIPGRKNLIWFSGSFPITILPDTTLQDPFSVVASSEDEFRETVTMLSTSQVAVYPVDARGLFNSPLFDAATPGTTLAGRGGAARIQRNQYNFATRTAEEHSTMQEMASATGGRAFVNTNGLVEAVSSAIDEGSNFYSISYVPTNPVQDGKMRKIKVRVDQHGLTLAYRQGYFADRPAAAMQAVGSSVDSTTALKDPVYREGMRLAMMRGAPTPTEIMMRVGVVPMTPAGGAEDTLAQGNSPAGKLDGPYRRYTVNYAVDPADVSFVRQSDSTVHGDVNLIVFVYTTDGRLINTLSDHVHLAGTLEEIKKTVADGLICHEEISTPAKGTYILRVAVRDEHKDRYGAVEVATSQLQYLGAAK